MAGEKAKLTGRAELLALADHALAEARRFREEWLVSGDMVAWRLAEAAAEDRQLLLTRIDDGRYPGIGEIEGDAIR